MYEIMGVSLVDMSMWRWIYDHPKATAQELCEATVRIAQDVWNEYYEPVLGEHDCVLLAVYSHMVNAPMYLPNYPLGHIVQYQLEEHLAQFTSPAANLSPRTPHAQRVDDSGRRQSAFRHTYTQQH